MSDIKILVYSHVFSQNAPSLYARIYDEYSELSKLTKLIVIAEEITEKETESISLVKVSKVSGRFIHVIFRAILFFLASIKQKNQYSIIYLRVLDFAFLAACILTKKFLKKKLVIWISNAETGHKSWQRNIYRYLYKKIIHISDAICCSSDNDISIVEKFIGEKLDAGKVEIIKPGVNTSRFKPQEKNVEEKILLCVARIAPIKLIDYLIKTIPFVKKSYPNIRLKLIGPIEDKKYHQELKSLAQKLDCKKNIEFIGPVPYQNLNEHYGTAKIFLQPTESAGTSTVTFEAMACGCPVIVAPIGARKELIQDGLSGFLLNNKDPEILAKKIIELLGNEEYRVKIGLQGRKFVEEKLNFENHFKNLAKVIINVLN